jgi:HSP90 family molecular chaperone
VSLSLGTLPFMPLLTSASALSLTVSRNTLSSSKFISQLSRTLVKRSLDLFAKLATNEPAKYAKLYKLVGHAFKAGIADRSPEKAKLAGLLRFESNHNNSTSLDDVRAEGHHPMRPETSSS